MKKRKQWLALLTALGIVFSMTACTDAGGTPEQTEGNAVTVSEVTPDETAAILPPHDDWTYEEFNQVISFNGKHVTFPCTLNDLGKDYKFDGKVEYDEIEKQMFTFVNYKGKRFGLAYINGSEDSKLNRDSEISILFSAPHLWEDFEEYPDIKVNGLTFGDSYESVIKSMGEPYSTNFEDSIKSGSMNYFDKEYIVQKGDYAPQGTGIMIYMIEDKINIFKIQVINNKSEEN